jgi:acetylornithine deacetylase
MKPDVVDILSELVRIPSVNPMGRPLAPQAGDIYYEHRVTAHLEKLFRGLGLPTERHTVAPQRDNIVTRLDGDVLPEKGGPILMFEAHQDTVPVEGMSIEPFNPVVKDGKLYGRGSCDIKGGMAAMIAALARLAAEKPKGRPTVVLACTINEEHGFTGATHWAATYSGKMPDSGHGPEKLAAPGKTNLLPRKPDATIVAEPTQMNVVVAHKGAARWRCQTRGVATHSSQPHLGENAIYHMARVLQVLEQYAREVVPNIGSHPLCGHPTLSVGLISGGISVNTVPDRATIEIDRRILPGEDPQAAFEHCVSFINSHVTAGTPVIHDTPFMLTRGLADEANGQLASRLGAAIKQHGGGGEAVGVPYGTDAPHFAATGCPTVVFGPGSIDQAHTADEWVEVTQLRTAAEILFDYASDGW